MRNPKPLADRWHVMARGVEKRDIFLDRDDRHFFMGSLDRFARKLSVRIHVFTLMSNHYHLLLSARTDVLSKFMARINWSHSFHFNRKYDRRGHLFEDRYLAYPIRTPMKLIELSCYSHHNPVTAGIAQDPASFEWSSFRYYFQPGVLTPPSWLDLGAIADALGVMGFTLKDDYLRLLNQFRGDERDSWMARFGRESIERRAGELSLDAD